MIYLLGVDEIETSNFGTSFVIYQGHHGDRGAHRADVILPGAAYSEKEATYVNMEGRVQQNLQALLPPGDAKEDWGIIRALADQLGVTLPYQTLAQVRDAMTKNNSIFGAVNQITPAVWEAFDIPTRALDSTPFAPHDYYFYQRNPISRASKTMADCQDQHDLLLKSGVSHHG